ncbi:MAG: flagellar basal body-associated FliL family protein [Spirochaetales bacterium]|nr:flagellar basal body-associated FliL family protein [Spirochaetales bacterium]
MKTKATAILFLLLAVFIATVFGDDGQKKTDGSIFSGNDVVPPPEALQYYKNMDPVRGMTVDNPPNLFTASVILGYPKDNIALTGEVLEKAHKIHAIILKTLSEKKADELSWAGVERLQQELLEKINRILTTGKLKLVLFKELQAFPW